VAEYSTQLASTQQVSYLTTDHLGSPRVTTDQNGVVTNRKDFSAFGEETLSAQRTSGLKYQPDSIRQDYTGYEKDDESGLEFAQARYYNSTHGRYTSIDPLTASANVKDPQTLNRYSYVLNSPYKFVDPLGLLSSSTGACGSNCPGSMSSMGLIGLYSDNGQVIKIGHDSQQTAPPPPPPPPTADQNPEPPTPTVLHESSHASDLDDGVDKGFAKFDDTGYRGSNAQLITEIGDLFFAYVGDGHEFEFFVQDAKDRTKTLTNYSATVDTGSNAPVQKFAPGDPVKFTLFLTKVDISGIQSVAGLPTPQPTINDPTSKAFTGNVTLVSGGKTTKIEFATTVYRNESGTIYADPIRITNFTFFIDIAKPK